VLETLRRLGGGRDPAPRRQRTGWAHHAASRVSARPTAGLGGGVFACVKWVPGLKRVNLRGLAKLSGLVKFAAAARNIWRRPNCRRSVVGLA
jgi:hypothetical protein